MVVAEFEIFLYNILSEESYKNQRLDMADEKGDCIISYYGSQNCFILIGETWTCLTCQWKKNN